MNSKRSGDSLRESTLGASSEEELLVTLDRLDTVKKVLLVRLDELGQAGTNVTKLDKAVICFLSDLQRLAELASKVQGRRETTPDQAYT